MSNPKLSVIIPCYNEEKRFQDGFNHYFSYLRKQHYSWELIFVNDGSRDKTLRMMQTVSKRNPNIKILSYPRNRGKGYAVAYGVKRAKGKYILFADIDHSVSIGTIEKFFEYFQNGFSVVIGSRRVSGAKIVVRQHLMREWLGRGFTFLVNLLIYWGIKDATCGFKVFENKIAQKIFNKIKVYDWAFDAEILYLLRKFKIKIAQSPVVWSDVTGSKVSLKRDVLRSFIGFFKIYFNDALGRY